MIERGAIRALLLFALINLVGFGYAFWGPPYVEQVAQFMSRPMYLLFLKCIHVVVFFFWTLYWVRFCNHFLQRMPLGVLLLVPPAAAVISEVAQIKIPGHRVQVSGAVASLIGVLLAYAWLLARNSRRMSTAR